jgi:hypothetical protein
VNPLERRTSVITAVMATAAVGLSVALSGCSAGQVSQTATQEPAINGTSGKAGPIALRNVHLRALQTTDYVQPGRDVELIFTAANTSADVNDKLLRITSDVGTVTLTGDGALPANGVLVVGTPDGQTKPLENVKPADAAQAKVALNKPVTNGLTYNFTFTFEKSGEATVPVPISAGETPRREVTDDGAPAGGQSGGH